MSINTAVTTPIAERSSAATVAFGLGLVAALLTTILGYVSLVAGTVALIAGVMSWRRHGPSSKAAAGMAMSATSIYIVLLEISGGGPVIGG